MLVFYLQVLSNAIQLTVIESLQSTLFEVFDVCGFGDVARPMLNVGVDFTPIDPVLPVQGAGPSQGAKVAPDSSELPQDRSMQSSVPNLSSNLLPGVIILVLHFTAVGLTAGDYCEHVGLNLNQPRPLHVVSKL